MLQAGVTAEEVKKARRRKKFKQEDHFDDCGSDLAPLEFIAWTFVFGADGSLGASIGYSLGDHQGCCSSSVEPSEEDLERVLPDNFDLHFSAGSGGDGPGGHHRAAQVPVEQFCGHLNQLRLAGLLDVLGVFGGVGGVGKLALRRRLRTGDNSDLVTGVDLCKPDHQRHVLNYIAQHRPLVVVLAPPCTPFGHWAHLHRVLHLATWQQSRRIGEILARFAARVVRLPIDARRYFLLENLVGSGLFSLKRSKEIWETGRVAASNAPQCALGFVVDGEPIYKITTLWSSIDLLLKPFIGVRCYHQQHGLLSGKVGRSARTKLAQFWLRPMCQKICNGIQMLLHSAARAARYMLLIMFHACTQLSRAVGQGVGQESHPWV